MRQPPTHGLADPVKGCAAGLEPDGGQMLVHMPSPAHGAVSHGQVAGGVLDDQEGDVPPFAAARRVQAGGIEPGLHHAQVNVVGPYLPHEAAKCTARFGHGEAPADQRPNRKANDFHAVGDLMLRQAGQRAGNHQHPVPMGQQLLGQAAGVSLDPAHGGQVLSREKTDGHAKHSNSDSVAEL